MSNLVFLGVVVVKLDNVGQFRAEGVDVGVFKPGSSGGRGVGVLRALIEGYAWRRRRRRGGKIWSL